MMYIRTKDGRIVDTTKYPEHPASWGIQASDYALTIKQSENLEELCDEFVMTHYFKETNYTKCEVLKEDKDLMIKAVRLKKQHNKDKDLKNEFNIYGAIWTDRGLIYVAKMNENGDLELI